MILSEKLPQLSLVNNHDLINSLKYLLDCLEEPKTRKQAILYLHEFYNSVKSLDSNNKLNLSTIELLIDYNNNSLKLFLNDAVFTPEDWGKTFAEGLLKKNSIFNDKSLVELGTGTGWIAILLLKNTNVKKIIGLDINSIAVLLANLNIWLNGTNDKGDIIYRDNGDSLIDGFKAYKSDLLAYPIKENLSFDFVIGCIPQVIHPSAKILDLENPSNKDLLDLSNYCFKQGIIEDYFGLPLIARAIEESQLVLNKSGKVIFVIGGRPGHEVIDRMFKQRGFDNEVIWSRRIQQADDTSLDSLIEVEENQNIRFHFFLSSESNESICADTAKLMQARHKSIYHDLTVYQALPIYNNTLLKFVKSLNSMGMIAYRNEFDFSNISEESLKFCNHLIATIINTKQIPYPHEFGSIKLRENLSRFLLKCCNYQINPDNLFIGPQRKILLSIILKFLADSKSTVLISDSLEKTYLQELKINNFKIIHGNNELNELITLDNCLNPDMILISPNEFNNPSSLALNVLINQALQHPDSIYIIDDSNNFEINSDLNSNLLIKLLNNYKLPPNIIFIYGLIKSIVSRELELSFILNCPKNWLRLLDIGCELTYSRIAYPIQLYYEWLFDEILAFPNFTAKNLILSGNNNFPISSKLYNKLDHDEVFKDKIISLDTNDLIRFDYGENELPAPDSLIKSLLLSFLDTKTDTSPELVRNSVSSYFKHTRNQDIDTNQILLGQGVFPLLGGLIAGFKEFLGRKPIIGVPSGTYGVIYPLIQYHGGIVQDIETSADNGFLYLDPTTTLTKLKPDLLWLTQPANPSGFYYTPSQIKTIINYCQNNDIYILSDEIFFLMSSPSHNIYPGNDFSFLNYQSTYANIFVCDGLAKAYAAGGIRFGFMTTPNTRWRDLISRYVDMPPLTTLKCANDFYCQFDNCLEPNSPLLSYLLNSQNILELRRNQLLDLLMPHGLTPNPDQPRGGLFIQAKFEENWVEIAQKYKVLLNSDRWSKTKGYQRICFSTTQRKFDLGIKQLRRAIKDLYGSN